MNNQPTVSLVTCSNYETGLAEAMDRLLAQLGGMESFVKPGQSVLIKPNMLTDRTPEQAVTTHPEVVRHIIRMVRQAGGKPSVADSPSSEIKRELVFEKTGFKTMCAEEDCPLINLESAGSVTFESKRCTFSIAKPVLHADVIINVPKVKSHVLTILTAATKNLYGAVPGYQKALLHKAFPRANDFGKLICEIYDKLRPTLNIADGIVGMDGDGPAGGKPVQLGFLAAADDAVTLDLTLCRILKIKPQAVPYLKDFIKERKGQTIQIEGKDPDELTLTSFNVPTTIRARLIPGWLVRLLERFLWIRPAFNERCVSCGRCVTACPVQALTLEKNQRPLLAGLKCIGCCCCHEICPVKAIDMTQSPLLNLARRGRLP